MGNGKWKMEIANGLRKKKREDFPPEGWLKESISSIRHVQIHFKFYRIQRTFFGRTLNVEKKVK